MVTRRALLLLPLLAACGPDLPETCTPGLQGDRVGILSYQEASSGNPPLRFCIDGNVASRRDATAASPGRDDSHGTSRAGVIPWTNVTYAEAAQACGRAGKFLCERRVLYSIYRLAIAPWGADIDARWIDRLHPTSAEPIPVYAEPLLYYQHLGDPYPDAGGSVPVWTAEGYIMGRLLDTVAQSGDPTSVAPPLQRDFKHPLLGFRCCLEARLQGVFDPLQPDPSLIREEEDHVPVAR